MHPAIVLIPVTALILGPRLWVGRVLKQHNRREFEAFPTGAEMAKQLLDRYQLAAVNVEWTDIGDHYDPLTKSVRLTRDKFERKTLTAITTAAHEVAHAVQDATDYGPFFWRTRLVKVAQATGLAGSVVLVVLPATAILTSYRMSPLLVGATVSAMLATGLTAQMAALPTELDASFRRALPWLTEECLDEQQAKDAREILIASSFTYIASSLLAVLNIWPWLGARGPVRLALAQPVARVRHEANLYEHGTVCEQTSKPIHDVKRRVRRKTDQSALPTLVRNLTKPVVRAWFRWRLGL